MQKPLISILIPYKSTELYIEDCLVSIINQSYTNWEAICINDNSEDNSSDIVSNFTKKDVRFKAFKNEGEGIIDTLKTAYKKSSGSYITRMDSDDLMTPNRLELMLNKLETYGKKHLAIGQVKYFRADGISNGYAKYETWLNQLTENGINYSEIYKECVIPSPCWMLHREDFETCGGFTPNRYPEDYDLAFRFYRAGFTCIPCKTILLHWRDYSLRTSRTHKHYAQNSFLDLKVDYFLELDYDVKRPLTLWGAGKKGKSVAKLLIEKEIPFYWICDNPKKIGKHIYDVQLHSYNYLQKLQHPQSIITVANNGEQSEIKKYFETLQMKSAKDYFFFC